MNTLPLAIPRFVSQRITGRSFAMNAAVIVGASLLIALSAQFAVPVPFSPVPMTLQPLALILVGAALGSARGAAAATLYLLEGLSGLPVFSQGRSGLVMLMGPTAGYLFAYPAATWIAGFVAERGWNRSMFITGAGMIASIGVLYLGGWSWLAGPLGLGAKNAFLTGIAPFVVADLVKVAIATVVLPVIQTAIDRATAPR